MTKAALGFRVKSGWAMAVLLSGPKASPTVVDRRRIELADPTVHGSAQPFHAGLELPPSVVAKTVGRLVKVVERFSAHTIKALLEEHASKGFEIKGVAIAAGSLIDPQMVKNDHIRAHAQEGSLFRRVIEEAVTARELTFMVISEKELMDKAVTLLKVPEQKLKQELTAIGKALGGPWRAEEKAAALAAWMQL